MHEVIIAEDRREFMRVLAKELEEYITFKRRKGRQITVHSAGNYNADNNKQKRNGQKKSAIDNELEKKKQLNKWGANKNKWQNDKIEKKNKREDTIIKMEKNSSLKNVTGIRKKY